MNYETAWVCIARTNKPCGSCFACERNTLRAENTAFERINREVGDMHKLVKTENDTLRAELERVRGALTDATRSLIAVSKWRFGTDDDDDGDEMSLRAYAENRAYCAEDALAALSASGEEGEK